MLSCFSRVRLFAPLWTVVLLAPLSMGFSRQEYWSGLLFSPPGDLPSQGVEPSLLHLLYWQVDSSPLRATLGDVKLHFLDEPWAVDGRSAVHQYSLDLVDNLQCFSSRDFSLSVEEEAARPHPKEK